MGYPKLAGWWMVGKSQSRMDDEQGYPYDSGNPHMDVPNTCYMGMVHGHPIKRDFVGLIDPNGLMNMLQSDYLVQCLTTAHIAILKPEKKIEQVQNPSKVDREHAASLFLEWLFT